jgi:hypothetical protein
VAPNRIATPYDGSLTPEQALNDASAPDAVVVLRCHLVCSAAEAARPLSVFAKVVFAPYVR